MFFEKIHFFSALMISARSFLKWCNIQQNDTWLDDTRLKARWLSTQWCSAEWHLAVSSHGKMG